MPRFLVASLLLVSLLAQDAALERARQVNLDRAAHMPNFIADEVAKRYTGHLGSSKWKYLDTIEDEVTLKGMQISRQNWRLNGKPWKNPDGYPSTGFGEELKPLFSLGCPTVLEPAGREQLAGKEVLAYRFTSPADGCFSHLFANWETNPARTGRMLIDDASGDLVQFEEEAADLPKGFGFLQRNEVLTWGEVTISGVTHLLPVSAEFIWRINSRGDLSRVTVEYRNHRHFEASTNVSFK
jgi:hypothetical protein